MPEQHSNAPKSGGRLHLRATFDLERVFPAPKLPPGYKLVRVIHTTYWIHSAAKPASPNNVAPMREALSLRPDLNERKN